MVFNSVGHVLVSYRIPKTADDDSQKTRWEKDDLGNVDFWRGVFAECLALAIFIPIAPGSSVGWSGGNTPTNTLIALANGLGIATLIQCFSHVSGAQFNPSVTIPLVIYRQISISRGLFYVVAQCLGSVCGAAILRAVTPADKQTNVGMTLINYDEGVSLWQAFGVEFVITFHLVFMVFATIDPRRTDIQGSSAVAIGFTVATGLLYGIPYTGASMNPARSFGPALVALNWKDHWVYWASPILAGISAASVYKFLFAEKAAVFKLTSCCCKSEGRNRSGRRRSCDRGPDRTTIEATNV
ncbi:aquaporin AQPAe.a-like [Lytechinus pictus]|uniref:aquaporin AQPAe.a-like n=1 Tax=Lytechinus pictus TaxID=7653 RepID=UPI0030B9FFBA